MSALRDETGMLMELPLVWGAYLMIVALVLPAKYWVTVWPLVLLVLLGLPATWLMGLAISSPRVTLLRVPACAWAFALLAVGTVPLMLWLEEGRAVLVILGAQVWGAFWIDAGLAHFLEKRRESRSS
jgi:hypothetical protein